MGIHWGDLNARAAGLGTHLLGAEERRRLASAPDVEALFRMLPGRLRPSGEARRDARAVDRHAGAMAAERLAVLDRWAGERRESLAGLLEEEDRRSVRALLRGAAAGTPPEMRRDGLVPTPTFPARLQEEAARASDLPELVGALQRAGHPLAPALEDALAPPPGSGGAAELFRLEMALARAFADRAVAGAERAGSSFRRYVAASVDLENAWTVLSAGGAGAEEREEGLFLEGGHRLGPEEFDELMGTPAREDRRRELAGLFAGSAVGSAFTTDGPEAALERRALEARLGAAEAQARRDPLGPGPLLAFVLRLRAEAEDLRRIAWGLALEAPAPMLRSAVGAGR